MLRPLVEPGDSPLTASIPAIISVPDFSFRLRMTLYHLFLSISSGLFRIAGPEPVSNLNSRWPFLMDTETKSP